MTKHVLIRIVALIILLFMAIPIGMSQLDPNRRCGTADSLAIIFNMGIFLLLWIIYLIVESVFLYRKNEIPKFRFNIIAALIIPLFILISFLFNLLD